MVLGLGDIVHLGWSDGYADGTVCAVHDDGSVDVFRPFVHTSDFSYGGGDNGTSRICCYIGIEIVTRLQPHTNVKLLRKNTATVR